VPEAVHAESSLGMEALTCTPAGISKNARIPGFCGSQIVPDALVMMMDLQALLNRFAVAECMGASCYERLSSSIAHGLLHKSGAGKAQTMQGESEN
jgi:hypothetical protein